MENAERILRGLPEYTKYSTFIDADDLQDASDKDWLDKVELRDYTTFGEMRKIVEL